MRVYLATAGEYSDYFVLHVFAHRADAENYPLADRVEEFEMHEGPVEVQSWHILQWSPDISDREADDTHLANPWVYSDQRDYDAAMPAIRHTWTQPGSSRALLRVEGWDLARVKKTYSEQRAQYLAKAAGLT